MEQSDAEPSESQDLHVVLGQKPSDTEDDVIMSHEDIDVSRRLLV